MTPTGKLKIRKIDRSGRQWVIESKGLSLYFWTWREAINHAIEVIRAHSHFNSWKQFNKPMSLEACK